MTNYVFGKVVTAMVTPFTEDNKVNYAVAEELAAYLVNNGSDGVLVCGTTGESPTLTRQEEYELFAVVKQAVAGKAKVIAGTGSNSTSEAIAATQKAASMGLDGSLQVVPYYNKPPQEGLYQHFKAIAQASPDLPMMLYNIPGRTAVNLEVDTVAKLAEIDNIVAIKEASGKLDQVAAIRRATPDSFCLYSGDDFFTLPMLTVGGSGVVSVSSHLVGNKIQQMIQAFIEGNTNLAIEINLELFPLFKALFLTTNPIPVKTALNLQGWKVGGVRLPLSEITPEIKQKIEAVLKQLSLLK